MLRATLTRADLVQAFGNNPKIIAYFEQQQRVIDDTAAQTAQNVAATQGAANATLLLLSSNDGFQNARIFAVGAGLAIRDDGPGAELTIGMTDYIQKNGAHRLTLNLVADTNVDVPAEGTLLVREDFEGGPYANDAAAAADGVPVGGFYRQPLGVVAWRQA